MWIPTTGHIIMYPYIGTYQLPQCILYINGHDRYLCDCVIEVRLIYRLYIAILSKYIVATIELCIILYYCESESTLYS